MKEEGGDIREKLKPVLSLGAQVLSLIVVSLPFFFGLVCRGFAFSPGAGVIALDRRSPIR